LGFLKTIKTGETNLKIGLKNNHKNLENHDFKRIIRLKGVVSMDLLQIMKRCGAYWEYKPGGPHVALFVSGFHSTKLYNFSILEQDPIAMDRIGSLLAEKARKQIKEITDFSKVIIIATDTKSRIFGSKFAEKLGSRFAFCFKQGNKQGELLRISSFDPKDDEIIVIFDRIFTYGGSALGAFKVIKKKNSKARFVLRDNKIIVFSLIFRHVIGSSSLNINQQFEVIPLLDDDAYVWSPEECPLCMKGSTFLDLNNPTGKREFQNCIK
jgi:orotate phosphoribosyltransferase